MTRIVRSLLVAFVVIVVGVPMLVRATSPQAQSAPSLTTSQAAAFVGEWVVGVSMGANEATSLLSIKDAGGKVVATMTSAGQPATTITNISMSGSNLVLRYLTNIQNNSINTVLTLTPDGTGLRVSMSVMDGQYELSGSATKAVPGQPVRLTGFGGEMERRRTIRRTSHRSHHTARVHPRSRRPVSCSLRGIARSSWLLIPM